MTIVWRLINHSPKIIKILFIIFSVMHLDWQPSTHSDVSRQTLVIVTSLGFNTHVLFIGVSYHSWATSALDKPNSFPRSVALLPCFSCRANIYNVDVVFSPSQVRREVAWRENLSDFLTKGEREHHFIVWYVFWQIIFGCACKRSDLVSRVSATNIFSSHFFTEK